MKLSGSSDSASCEYCLHVNVVVEGPDALK